MTIGPGKTWRSLTAFAARNAIPLMAVSLILTIQASSLFVGAVRAFATSYVGSFTQGILTTVAFGQITTATVRRARHNRRIGQIYEILNARVTRGQELDCEELREAFLGLRLLAELRRSGWSTQVDATPSECGVFVLGYQYHGHAIEIFDFDSSCLTELASRAAEDESYRRLVLTHALSAFVPREELDSLASEIEARAVVRFRVTSRFSEADVRLEHKIRATRKDRLTIVSTTSQTSDFLAGIIARNGRNLEKVEIAHVSPLVVSHPTLRRQSAGEARVPTAVKPEGQQIADPETDMLRRGVRILTGLDKLWNTLELPADTALRTVAFTQSHPGVKIRGLRKLTYLQIFPGRLDYADNLYRFGYELTDAPLVARINGFLDSWMADRSERFPSRAAVAALTARGTGELARWLLAVPDAPRKISDHREQLFSLLPEPAARNTAQEVLDRFSVGLAAIEGNDVAPTRTGNSTRDGMNQHRIFVRPARIDHAGPNVVIDNGNRPAHVSAGVVVRHGDRVLVVRKTKPPNEGRWSIPAGHCEWGESGLLAARRELHEEVGIETTALQLMFRGMLREGQECRYGVSDHLWFLFRHTTPEIPRILLARSELEEYRWVDRAGLDELTEKTPAFAMLLRSVDAL
ncbi:hypothetical protein GCM10022227_29810 [Streptomyces sedi]